MVPSFDKRKKILAKDEIIFALGAKKQVSDHFDLDTGTGYMIQFAVYSYKLHYGGKE